MSHGNKVVSLQEYLYWSESNIDYTHYFFVKFFLASSTLRGVENEIFSFDFLKLECKILMFSEEANNMYCHTIVRPYYGT